MIRILTVAAAAAIIAAPASAQSIRIATAGKSPAQLHAEITKAAKKVCSQAVVGASFPREMYESCYKHAVADAVAKAGDPALADIAHVKLAQR
jgi:hypothetical protein